jgi:hypothetical protein
VVAAAIGCDAYQTPATIASAMSIATMTAIGATADCRALRTTSIFRNSSRVGPAGLGTIPFWMIYAMRPLIGSDTKEIDGWSGRGV